MADKHAFNRYRKNQELIKLILTRLAEGKPVARLVGEMKDRIRNRTLDLGELVVPDPHETSTYR